MATINVSKTTHQMIVEISKQRKLEDRGGIKLFADIVFEAIEPLHKKVVPKENEPRK